MTFYERFEQVIALALSAIIAVIIVVSLLQLISIVFSLLIIDHSIRSITRSSRPCSA